MGGGECVVVLGHVVLIHVDRAVLTDGRLDLRDVGRPGRMGGTEYVRSDDVIDVAGAQPAAAEAVTDYVFE